MMTGKGFRQRCVWRCGPPGTSRGRRWHAAVLAAVLLTSTGCLLSSRPNWWESCPADKGDSPLATVEAAEQLVVYLDVSRSMQGFVSERRGTEAASAQTVFSKALLELRNIVNSLSPQPRVVLRVVDDEVRPAADAFQLARYSINRDWYRGNETNLAGAFKAFQESPEPGAGAAPARFHILVTDGVQSSKRRRPDLSCLQGSDADCVKERINELLGKGWGGALLGLRSDFKGKVFSEIRPGQSVEYATDAEHPDTFRPCYFYVFSPDQAALDQLVKALKDGLRPLLRSADHLREYTLTAHYFGGTPTVEFASTDEKTLTVHRERNAPAGAACFNVDIALPSARQAVATRDDGGQPAPDAQIILRVPWSHHALDSGTPQEVAGLMKWALTPTGANPEQGALYPLLKITGSTANADGSVTLQLSAKWEEGAGKRRERVYRLVGRLDLEKNSPPWVGQWSTDTDETQEEAARTLNLKISLANLWNNQFLQRQEVTAACLRAGDF